LGFPAVAISLSGECNHYQAAATVMSELLAKLSTHSLGSSVILNVNVPDLPMSEIKGYRITRLGCRHRADNILPSVDPRGHDIYWIGPPSEPQDVGEGTDFDAVKNGYVSITPLTVDLTAYQSFSNVGSWIDELN